MTKKPKAIRKPTNRLLAAAKLKDAVAVRLAVAAWLGDLLNDEAGLAPGAISDTDDLRLWGYASEEMLVRIAFKFNTTMKRQRTIRPPDLILNVSGKTVGDLIDFIVGCLLRQSVSPAGTNSLSDHISVDLTLAGESLLDKIVDFVMETLEGGYKGIARNSPLSYFHDNGATFNRLAGTFVSEAGDGRFKGLIDANKLTLPDYMGEATKAGATVYTISKYFLARAKLAAPR
jgi:hypothetical protein